MERTYRNALSCLNDLQTTATILERNRAAGIKSVPNVPKAAKEWLKRIGYTTTDLTKLNIIHIAGTKGKGTTCTLIDSLLREHRLRRNFPQKIGLYTSPHLKDVRERIRINSQPISEYDFAKYFFDVYEKLTSTLNHGSGNGSGDMPGYFRFLTLMSFHVFLKEEVDVTICETGIGGENDITNIIEKPVATGITTLGIDHVKTLGSTISDIAWHKGGIFKCDCPAYTSPQIPDALTVLKDRAQNKGTQLVVVDSDQEVFPGTMDTKLQELNGPLAIALANEFLKRDGEQLSKGDVSRGLQNACSLGRLHTISGERNKWHLDGAHTMESIKVATDWFTVQVNNNSSLSTYILIFNQDAARDGRSLLRYLFAILSQNKIHIDHAIFCTNKVRKDGTIITGQGQGMEVELQTEYAQIWNELDPLSRTTVKGTIEEAIESVDLLGQTTQVFITGSLHLVGGALTILEK